MTANSTLIKVNQKIMHGRYPEIFRKIMEESNAALSLHLIKPKFHRKQIFG